MAAQLRCISGNLRCGFLVAGKIQAHELDCRRFEEEGVFVLGNRSVRNDEERVRLPDAPFTREPSETARYFLGAL
jgi:hypothetical protein